MNARDRNRRNRALFELELRITEDLEDRWVYHSAIVAGHGTEEWSRALSLIAVRHINDAPGWENRALRRPEQPSWWRRNRPYVLSGIAAALIGGAVGLVYALAT